MEEANAVEREDKEGRCEEMQSSPHQLGQGMV